VKDKIVAGWSTLSAGQGVSLAGLFLMVGYVIVHLPPEVWERIAQKDPGILGAAVGSFILALIGAASGPKSPTPPQGPTT
jgi:hypothetical protein